jgi:hypothetical protein
MWHHFRFYFAYGLYTYGSLLITYCGCVSNERFGLAFCRSHTNARISVFCLLWRAIPCASAKFQWSLRWNIRVTVRVHYMPSIEQAIDLFFLFWLVPWKRFSIFLRNTRKFMDIGVAPGDYTTLSLLWESKFQNVTSDFRDVLRRPKTIPRSALSKAQSFDYAVAYWLSRYATSRKVAGSTSNEVHGFYQFTQSLQLH